MIVVVITQLATLFIPSPSEGVWHLGPVPIRAYALCIILGVVAAVWLGEKRWVARGGIQGQIGDVALWAVPFGLIGARAYHVATDHDLYFGTGFSVYTYVKATQPAVINKAVSASLRSSDTSGYGLELYIPIPQELRQPIAGSSIYPTVQKVVATVNPSVASVKVKGTKGKVKIPLVGLGPCTSSKKEPFQMSVNYSDAAGLNTVKTDSASSTGTCK